MPDKATSDVVLILRRQQEDYPVKVKQLYMCFVNLEKGLVRVPSNVLE